MIQIKNICLSFGQRHIFDDITLTIDPKERIGLVGLNGAGKSTLLKAIAKEQTLDDGLIQISRDMTIAYMSQETVLLTDKTVIDEALTVFGDFELEEKARHVAEIVRMLEGLGFSKNQMDGLVSSLSVGWKMRLVLAKLLLKKADFYLFDEPTNHLDIFAKDWFVPFLKNMSAGFLLVCHEQYVLDELCTKIIDVSRGKATAYRGNYSAFVDQKQAADERQMSAYEQQQKMIAQKKETIERFRAKASKAKMAQSMMKELEKIELLSPPETVSRSLVVPLPAVQRSGRIVLEAEQVGFSFGDKKIFSDVHLKIERGEKVALVSANGMGKTTLFNCIAGVYPLQKGSVTFGHNVEYALFHQDPNRSLDLKATVFDEMIQSAPHKTEQEVRSLLGAFMFSGNDIHKKIGVLSGGEKNRVAMVKVLLQPANFLLLDEPTNHLDMPSKQVLLNALRQYQGTVLFVSHDHLFLNELPTRILELTPKGVHSYQGNYEQFKYYKMVQEQESVSEKTVAKDTSNAPSAIEQPVVSQKDSYEARKRVNSLASKIEKLEEKMEALQAELMKYPFGTPKYKKIYDEFIALTQEHQTLFDEWESLQK